MPYPMLMASQRRLAAVARRSTGLQVWTRAAAAFSSKPHEMESFLSGTSSLYAEQIYDQYSENPDSVHASWKQYFDNLQEGVAFSQEDYNRPTSVPGKRSVAVTAVSRVEYSQYSTVQYSTVQYSTVQYIKECTNYCFGFDHPTSHVVTLSLSISLGWSSFRFLGRFSSNS
jgi:hypothetical protein